MMRLLLDIVICDKKKPKFFVKFTEKRTLHINTNFLMDK